MMPRYRLMASYGYAGTTTNLGEIDAETPDEAQDDAWAAAIERVDTWVEEIEDKESSE